MDHKNDEMMYKMMCDYILRTLIARTYQQSSVDALKMTGAMCDIIETCFLIDKSEKDEMIQNITRAYFNLWEMSHSGGYDE